MSKTEHDAYIREINPRAEQALLYAAALMIAVELFQEENECDNTIQMLRTGGVQTLGLFVDEHLVGASAIGATGNPDTLSLAYLVVAQSSRGRGLGRLLLEETERRAIERGAQRLSVEAGYATEDPALIAFLEHFGYTQVDPSSPETYERHLAG